MLKKRVFYLMICLIGSSIVMTALYFTSIVKSRHANGFVRLLPPHLIVPLRHKDLIYHSFYIAGTSGSEIYLGNYATPYYVWRLDYGLKVFNSIRVNWSKNYNIRKGAVIAADSSRIYLRDGNSSKILQASWNLNDITVYQTLPFTASMSLSDKTWLYRSISKDTINELVKQSFIGNKVMINRTLLQKQVDGVFSTDGMLIMVPNSSDFFYMYYYRNQFMLADSNMILLYRSNTVDTISYAEIKTKHIKSDKKTTMISPPTLVNRRGSANEKYLLINSALKADNDQNNILNDALIIDVYNSKDGKYKFSFYLPNYRGKRALDWSVHGNKLVAIYDTFITIYQLTFA